MGLRVRGMRRTKLTGLLPYERNAQSRGYVKQPAPTRPTFKQLDRTDHLGPVLPHRTARARAMQ